MDFSPMSSSRIELSRIEDSVRDLRRVVESMIDKASSQARDIERRFFSIKSRINMALWCTSLLLQASFKLYDDENMVSAYSVKLMGEEKVKGYLYITDKRLIFEAEKEIVLKKVLFIPTKKKKVREVVYDIPIGLRRASFMWKSWVFRKRRSIYRFLTFSSCLAKTLLYLLNIS